MWTDGPQSRNLQIILVVHDMNANDCDRSWQCTTNHGYLFVHTSELLHVMYLECLYYSRICQIQVTIYSNALSIQAARLHHLQIAKDPEFRCKVKDPNTGVQKQEYITPVLHDHSLATYCLLDSRVQYKHLTLSFKTNNCLVPAYLIKH